MSEEKTLISIIYRPVIYNVKGSKAVICPPGKALTAGIPCIDYGTDNKERNHSPAFQYRYSLMPTHSYPASTVAAVQLDGEALAGYKNPNPVRPGRYISIYI